MKAFTTFDYINKEKEKIVTLSKVNNFDIYK